MREQLLELLVEPSTGARLELSPSRSEGAEIVEGELASVATGKKYPIIDGIPRFVPQANYADSFGFQWNRFRQVQLDSATGSSSSRRRYDAEAGWTEDALRGKWLLDAGCGAGRFAEIAAEKGPNLVALDFSSAVDAAGSTLKRFANVHVVQGNLLEPPFRPGVFDYAYCIGVVQHTPDPPDVIRNIISCVAPGGSFAFTIYGRRPWTKLNGKYLLRHMTRFLPEPVLLRTIERVMPVLFPVTDVLFRLPVLGRAASFAIPISNMPGREELTDEQRYRETVLDTFDALSPRYDSPMTVREVEDVLRTTDASEWTFRTRVPVNVVGRVAHSTL